MTTPTLLIAESERFSPDALAKLRREFHVATGNFDRRRLLDAVRDATVLWVRLSHRIDQEVLEAGRKLKFVVSPTTGLNHIDLSDASRRGITVLSLQGEETFLRDIRATAELTMGLMLALLRKLPQAVASVRDGQWDRDAFLGRELYGKTIGVVGYGRLGRIVARYCRALDCRVVATDPAADRIEIEPGVEMMDIQSVLKLADIVTLHVNLNSETVGFFGERHFAAMKRGAVFVNTARGELIDEAALLALLESGHLAGAALDVLSNEQSAGMGTSQLVQFAAVSDRLIITPHIGGCTSESMRKTEDFMAEKLLSAVREHADAVGRDV